MVNAAWSALTYVSAPRWHLDVVSLGLVYDVRAEAGRVVVEMSRAARGRVGDASLIKTAQIVVADALSGAEPVEVRLVRDPPWSPAMIDPIAAADAGLPTG